MKKHWIEYRESWARHEPMTFWVHVEADGKAWYNAEEFDPPAPKPLPGRGWPVYCVEFDGFTFRFASLAELDVCVATLSRKILPTTRRLSTERGMSAGPNSHWLSRMPKGTKSWRYREKAVRYLTEAREDFVRETHAA
ncbi:hypothetical protein JOY44_23225 [Phormidium sp. CLA17]|uniref:hypothetical protein n=1 Tax=Leptolyngbya sp. Cla-17 TaxID=2803751 RepID=UPI00149222DD|nr:hypothetical protein [Leptolyngbya sp. Cla-17]MBM0744484.1 hypothetical protein [Leptolyngbya sp. Cla-17]